MATVRKGGVAGKAGHAIEEVAEVGIAGAIASSLWSLAKNGLMVTLIEEGKAGVKKFLEDKRAELAADMLMMEADEKKNLRRWHQEAIAKGELAEKRFAGLLCKLPAKEGSRIELLKRVNMLDDAEFAQILTILENDDIPQVYRALKATGQKLLNAVIPAVEERARQAGEGISNLFAAIDQRAEAAAPTIRNFADMLIERERARQRR